MKTMKRIIVVGFALAMILALAACGQSSGSGQGAAKDQAQGFEPRALSELKDMADKAVKEAKEIKGKESDKEQKNKANQLFHDGNTSYRSQNYSQASKCYQEALDADPGCYGANVNKVLSLLQEENNEEALAQALKCVALFPDDAGCLLNVLVAGTACKFSATDIDTVMDGILDECDNTSVSSVLGKALDSKKSDGASWDEAYVYNVAWNEMEIDLNPSDKSAVIAPVDAYLDLRDRLESIAKFNSDDEDFAALIAYLDAKAQQLNLNEENK